VRTQDQAPDAPATTIGEALAPHAGSGEGVARPVGLGRESPQGKGGRASHDELTPLGLVRILGQVTVILFVPMVGGAVAGIVLDRILGTTPLFVLGGFGLGNVVAIVGIALLIRSGRRRYGRASSELDLHRLGGR